MSELVIDLSVLPSGKRYEDTYGSYIDIFHQIAFTPAHVNVVVKGPPHCWVPLLWYLQCQIDNPRVVFEHCTRVKAACGMVGGFDRTEIEVLSSFRPETADALWKIDVQWDCSPDRVRTYLPANDFIVTTNGAFHRPEVLAYEKRLREYKPDKRKVVLVPCAADKPYPAPMHQAILEIMPSDYYMANVTGVLGIVPQDLWPVMPHYDSGIPNRWRVYQAITEYFTLHEHQHIIVYSDFYGQAIQAGVKKAGVSYMTTYVVPPVFRADYIDLMNPKLLADLKWTFFAG